MTKQNPIKCTKDCLIVFWLSIFAMIVISAIEGHTSSPELVPQNSIILIEYSQQDTIRKDSAKVSPSVEKYPNNPEKQEEYEKFVKRSEQIEKDMMRMSEQSRIMDSLLGKIDTVKIVQ